MFKIRTEPVSVGTEPYLWNIPSVYQCTWFAYYRALEVGYTAPCYWDRETRTGSYTNAKDWLKNFREPWEVKGLDYIPVAGDICVYDGTYGHVQFMETDTMYSQYSSGDANSFRNGLLKDYKGTLLGYLHYPHDACLPVERNVNVNQIQANNEGVRIRTKPSLKGDIVGHLLKGYYNVYSTKEADGYTWYEIEKNRYCANIDTIYLPSDDVNFMKELERYIDGFRTQYKLISNENTDLKKRLDKIKEIADYE